MNIEWAQIDTMQRLTLPGLGEDWYGSDENWTKCPTRFAGVVGDNMPARSDKQHGKPVCGGWPPDEAYDGGQLGARSFEPRLQWPLDGQCGRVRYLYLDIGFLERRKRLLIVELKPVT